MTSIKSDLSNYFPVTFLDFTFACNEFSQGGGENPQAKVKNKQNKTKENNNNKK